MNYEQPQTNEQPAAIEASQLKQWIYRDVAIDTATSQRLYDIALIAPGVYKFICETDKTTFGVISSKIADYIQTGNTANLRIIETLVNTPSPERNIGEVTRNHSEKQVGEVGTSIENPKLSWLPSWAKWALISLGVTAGAGAATVALSDKSSSSDIAPKSKEIKLPAKKPDEATYTDPETGMNLEGGGPNPEIGQPSLSDQVAQQLGGSVTDLETYGETHVGGSWNARHNGRPISGTFVADGNGGFVIESIEGDNIQQSFPSTADNSPGHNTEGGGSDFEYLYNSPELFKEMLEECGADMFYYRTNTAVPGGYKYVFNRMERSVQDVEQGRVTLHYKPTDRELQPMIVYATVKNYTDTDGEERAYLDGFPDRGDNGTYWNPKHVNFRRANNLPQ